MKTTTTNDSSSTAIGYVVDNIIKENILLYIEFKDLDWYKLVQTKLVQTFC